LNAIEELLTTAVKLEAGNLDKTELKPEDRKTAQERFLKVKDVLSKQPLFVIDGQRLRIEATAARGKLNINDKPVEPLEAAMKLGQTLQEAFAAMAPAPPPPVVARAARGAPPLAGCGKS